jgi:hypothetical protein
MFKPGQKIFCIDDDGRILVKGGIYTFLRYEEGFQFLFVEEKVVSFFTERFVDAEKYLHDINFNKKIENLIEE